MQLIVTKQYRRSKLEDNSSFAPTTSRACRESNRRLAHPTNAGYLRCDIDARCIEDCLSRPESNLNVYLETGSGDAFKPEEQ